MSKSKSHERRTRVLVVEDEESFIEALTIGLDREGFDATIARDGQEALAMFEEGRFDVILLDLMLPKLSGLDVCRSVRAASDVPIIIVSAKGEEVDMVLMLEVGADDYVTKPYRLRELVARIRAVLRRRESPAAYEESDVLAFGSLRMELDARRCFVNDVEVKLRKKEFALLRLLLENPGRVLTRDVLIDRVWGSDYVGDTKTLDVHIKRLRSLIEEDPKKPELISTVRGVGYRFEVTKPSA
ncbi:MAG: response regulator transcription factor [Acidobacteriota bacterium]|nr:response regulator transcription factor [Acidobacteriota bacterium]MDE3044364.1 response regulator transcription factor [Acidobacteriota bacterium]